MSKMSTSKTSVIGYFNPNDYPIKLDISAHNMVIMLEPKKYIIDRTGHMVNDPLLDSYVGKGRLSRASDPKQQVDIVFLRPVNPTPTPGQPGTAYTHAVSQATGFQVRDGRVQPVGMQPTAVAPAQVPPPASYNPVRGMSIEEAKKLKLIRPTKPVPEDYGAEEGTGAPRSGQEIPEIKYATDTGPRGRKPRPLPAELAQPATPAQAATIAALERAASANPDEVPIRPASGVAPIVIPATGPIPGLPKPQLTETAAAPTRTAPPIPANPQPTQMMVAALPPPPVEEEGGLVVDEELPTDPTVVIESDLPTTASITADDATGGITCPKCDGHAPFKNLGLYKRHIRRYHPTEESVLLAPFGGDVPA